MPGSADTIRESEQDAGLRSGGTAEGRGGGPHLEGGSVDCLVKRWQVWGTLLPLEGGSGVCRGNRVVVLDGGRGQRGSRR